MLLTSSLIDDFGMGGWGGGGGETGGREGETEHEGLESRAESKNSMGVTYFIRQ